MNGRILVLFGAIGLFIAAWNGGAPRPAAVARLAGPTFVVEQAPEIAVARVIVDSRTVAWEGHAAVVEIPPELAAGRYRVVSDQGEVATLAVTGTAIDSGFSAECKPAVAIQTVGSVHWYFIRLQAEAPAVAGDASAPAAGAEAVVSVHVDSPVIKSDVVVDTILSRAEVWNSKERDILLAQMRDWMKGIRGGLWARLALRSVPVSAPQLSVPATATVAQVDSHELGVVPEFNDGAELSDVSDLPEVSELPELLDVTTP